MRGSGKIVSIDSKHEEGGPSNSRFEQVMEAMVLALQMMQVKIGEFQHDKSQYMYEVSQAERDAAKILLKKMEKEIKKLVEKQKRAKTLGIFEKVAEALVGSIMVVLAAVLAQPELLIMAVMSFAAASGAMNYATKGIAEGLEELGMSREAAEIFAAGAVTFLVIGVTCGMSAGLDAEAVTEEATDVAADATEDGSSAVTETQENSFQNMQNTLKSDAPVGKKLGALKRWLNIFNRLSTRQNLALMATVQSLTQTNLISDIAVFGTKNKKKRKEIERDVEIAMAIVSIIVTLGSMDAVADGAETNSKTGKVVPSRLGRALNRLKEMMKIQDGESTLAFRVLNRMRQAGMVMEAGASGYRGAVGVLRGELAGEMGTIQANQELLHMAINMTSTEMKDDQAHDEQMEKSFRLGDRSLTGLNKGYAGFANLFTSHSPV